jgi:hypothetical protein
MILNAILSFMLLTELAHNEICGFVCTPLTFRSIKPSKSQTCFCLRDNGSANLAVVIDSSNIIVQHGKNQDSLNKVDWEIVSELASLQTPWLKLVGEKLRNHRGEMLDYWRVEKEHSAVILTIHRGRVILPRQTFRPGVGYCTLDFCGGRVPKEVNDPIQIVPSIVRRELGIACTSDDFIEDLDRMNSRGWPINSSFSNQLLFGFVATVSNHTEFDADCLHSKSYSIASGQEMDQLLADISCLQCRTVLMNWLMQRGDTAT